MHQGHTEIDLLCLFITVLEDGIIYSHFTNATFNGSSYNPVMPAFAINYLKLVLNGALSKLLMQCAKQAVYLGKLTAVQS